MKIALQVGSTREEAQFAAQVGVQDAVIGGPDSPKGYVEYEALTQIQELFAEYGLRPVDAGVAREVAKQFPAVRDLFTIRDLGGWSQVDKSLFGPTGAYERAMAAAH